jgi:hypothetical protein
MRLEINLVLGPCPNLKTLLISGTAINGEGLVRAAHKENAPIEELVYSLDDMEDAIDALDDRHEPFTQSLKRTVFNFSDQWSLSEESDLKYMLSMLDKNIVLDFVEANIPSLGWEHLAESMRKRDNVLLPVISRPFLLRCRLAFLSVLQASRRSIKRDERRANTHVGRRLFRVGQLRSGTAGSVAHIRVCSRSCISSPGSSRSGLERL